MTKIILDINDCRDCLKCIEERTEGAGWAFDYSCSLEKDDDGNPKQIMGYVEYTSDIEPVPDWCPRLLKKYIEKEKFVK